MHRLYRSTCIAIVFALAWLGGSAASEAPSRLSELKQRYSPEQLRSDDRLLAEFAAAHAAANDLEPVWSTRSVDWMLEQQPQWAQLLTADQIGAWREVKSQGWDGAVDWDARRLTPSSIRFGMTFRGPSGDAARADLEQRLGETLPALFGIGDDDALTLADVQDFEVPAPFGDTAPRWIHRVTFERLHGGLPVFGDRFVLTLAQSEHEPTAWDAWLSARWTREVESATAILDANASETAVRQAGYQGTLLAVPQLGYRVDGDTAQLAYELDLREGRDRYRYLVSALTGELLERSSQTADNHDGSLQAWVKRPYEDDTTPRPIPNAYIYEDTASVPAPPACYYNVNGNQTHGDAAQLNATTDYAGDYENAVHYDPLDDDWVVDFSGPYASDVSPYTNHTVDVPAGADHTIPDGTANARNRRAEMFYLLNYGRQVYANYFLPQYEPLGFSFDALGYEDELRYDCEDPDGPFACCAGGTDDGCIWLECGFGPTGAPQAEKRFREVVLHEQTHSLRYKAAGGFCSGCAGDADTDGSECNCWEEGRADFGAIALTGFEKHRAHFQPDLSYPGDYDGNQYSRGAIWTSIYVDYMLRAGLDAIGDVNRNLELIDTNTRMVGNCASASDWTTCPANSYFRLLIDSQELWTFPRWRNTQEISAAFHDHVTDTDRGTVGIQSFGWADETPNRLFNPPVIYTDFGAVDSAVASVGIEGGGAVKLDSADDFDNFMFKARAGESYTVGTDNLAAGVDTLLEVRTIDANQSYLVDENDDCGGVGPESCVTFIAQETGFHRIIVTSFPGTTTGSSATYQVYVELVDDIGDTQAEAAAFSPDDVMHDAQGIFEDPADVDVYEVVVPTAQDLGFLACSTDGSFKVGIELRNDMGDVIKSKQNKKCDKEPQLTAVAGGRYYLFVSSADGLAGSYGLRASLATTDIDVDDTPANAYTLTPDAFVGTMFEDASEEDWFRIEAQAGRIYLLEAIGVDAGVDTALEVYPPSTTMYGPEQLPDTSGHDLGHWMLSDDDGGLRPLDARGVFWAPVAGTYYVRVRPDAGSSAGRYHLVVHDNSGFTQAYPAMP